MIGLQNLLANVPAILCAGAGAYLCYLGKDGWGWFLFVAVMFGVTVTHHKKDGEKEEVE